MQRILKSIFANNINNNRIATTSNLINKNKCNLFEEQQQKSLLFKRNTSDLKVAGFSGTQQQKLQQQQQPTALVATTKGTLTETATLIEMATERPKIVFVLGGPGAGKGTQCSKIVDNYEFVHLSAGDLLREERARKDSEYGALIEEYIQNGKIVPVAVTCSLIEAAMKKSGKSKFLIDGFPRNQDNLDGWNHQMSDKVDFQFVLFFDCDEGVCVERCLNRGQSGSGRSDDNMESLKKRIHTYTNDSLPIINFFKDMGKVKHIDASPNADQVFEKVQQIFSESGLSG